jgi:hypothetical protein
VESVAAVDQDLAAAGPKLAPVRRYAVELLRRELAEERQVRQEGAGRRTYGAARPFAS